VGFVSEESKEGEVSRVELAPAADATPTLSEASESPKSKAFKIDRKREKRKLALFKRFSRRWPAAMRIDALGILAAILGLMSLGLPWIHELTGYDEGYYTLWHYMMSEPDVDPLVFGLATGGMLLGSILAVFSRFGGVVQLAGLISFVTISMSSTSEYAFGSYVAVAACILGISSMVLRRTFPLPDRLRTIVRSPEDGVVTINMLSMVGGALGVLSLFFVWYSALWTQQGYGGLWDQKYTLVQLAGPHLATPWTIVAAICIAAGSILSILTPLGFIGQLAGVSTYLYAMRDNAAYIDIYPTAGYYGYSPHVESSYGVGFLLGVVCLIIVIGSILVKWRVKLSGARASYVLSWPSRPLVTDAVATAKAEKVASWRGVISVFVQCIKALFVVIVVMILAIASAGIAYALPWSDFEIMITNSSPDSRVHFAVYIDGDWKVGDNISTFTQYIGSFDVRAGLHKVALDYGFPDGAQGTDVDGVIDWSTFVKAKPLRKSIVSVDLGFLFSEAPVMELNASDYGNGWKLSATSINDGSPSSGSISWGDLRIMLHEENGSASWETESFQLDNGTYCEQVFSPRLIGDITVNFSAVDLAGNGYLNVGDFILITTGTDHTFSSSATYTLYMLYQPTSSLASEVELQGRY
jgi:hypothetical protein